MVDKIPASVPGDLGVDQHEPDENASNGSFAMDNGQALAVSIDSDPPPPMFNPWENLQFADQEAADDDALNRGAKLLEQNSQAYKILHPEPPSPPPHSQDLGGLAQDSPPNDDNKANAAGHELLRNRVDSNRGRRRPRGHAPKGDMLGHGAAGVGGSVVGAAGGIPGGASGEWLAARIADRLKLARDKSLRDRSAIQKMCRNFNITLTVADEARLHRIDPKMLKDMLHVSSWKVSDKVHRQMIRNATFLYAAVNGEQAAGAVKDRLINIANKQGGKALKEEYQRLVRHVSQEKKRLGQQAAPSKPMALKESKDGKSYRFGPIGNANPPWALRKSLYDGANAVDRSVVPMPPGTYVAPDAGVHAGVDRAMGALHDFLGGPSLGYESLTQYVAIGQVPSRKGAFHVDKPQESGTRPAVLAGFWNMQVINGNAEGPLLVAQPFSLSAADSDMNGDELIGGDRCIVWSKLPRDDDKGRYVTFTKAGGQWLMHDGKSGKTVAMDPKTYMDGEDKARKFVTFLRPPKTQDEIAEIKMRSAMEWNRIHNPKQYRRLNNDQIQFARMLLRNKQAFDGEIDASRASREELRSYVKETLDNLVEDVLQNPLKTARELWKTGSGRDYFRDKAKRLKSKSAYRKYPRQAIAAALARMAYVDGKLQIHQRSLSRRDHQKLRATILQGILDGNFPWDENPDPYVLQNHDVSKLDELTTKHLMKVVPDLDGAQDLSADHKDNDGKQLEANENDQNQ